MRESPRVGRGLASIIGSARAPLVALALAAGCGDDPPGAGPDAGVTTAHCTFEPVAPSAHAGTPVTAAPLEAGAAEVALDVPVGTGLGGYTARSEALGNVPKVDSRVVPIAGAWQATVGIETRPLVKAVALRAGGETVLWLKVDAIFAYEEWLFELERRLGPDLHGKVLVSTSHSHSAWSQYTAHSPLKVGSGEVRGLVHDRFMQGIEAAARAALADLRPATIGFFTDTDFDPTDAISHERRSANDDLPGGNRKDERFHLIRIDRTSGEPIAIIPIVGMHPTLNEADNPLASTDSVGELERMVEERFDRPVVVMHVQAGGADTSATGHGQVDCAVKPGGADDPCFRWLTAEGHGRAAVDPIMAGWTAAGTQMRDTLALAMVTRSVELGPHADTYTIRDGALAYAPFDLDRPADGIVWNGGTLVSPIDEWNAPVGAALCETQQALFPAAAMPGTEGLDVYGSCLRIDQAAPILGQLLDISFADVSADRPACQTTRTTISALRLGEHLVATVPGELSVLLADTLRAASPIDSVHTIAVGYSQGHVGYCLTPEDWLQGGYEPSVTFNGPLEGEYLVERLAELMPLAMAATRSDGAAGGTDRVVMPVISDQLPHDRPAPQAGTIPATVPADLWMRAGRPAQAQPAAEVPRVAGLATFVWLGDDPLTRTPRVTLEREVGAAWAPVTRRSGRPVLDGDLIVVHAPSPLVRAGGPQQHVWAVEWQPVPWTGLAGLDGLGARGGAPLGRYRFRVEGDGWSLASDPFAVVIGPVTVAATRTGTTLRATAHHHAPKGYRLLDLAAPSNRPVPLRTQALTVTAFAAGGAPVGAAQVVTSTSAGEVTVELGAAAATVVRIRISDGYGNFGDATI